MASQGFPAFTQISPKTHRSPEGITSFHRGWGSRGCVRILDAIYWLSFHHGLRSGLFRRWKSGRCGTRLRGLRQSCHLSVHLGIDVGDGAPASWQQWREQGAWHRSACAVRKARSFAIVGSYTRAHADRRDPICAFHRRDRLRDPVLRDKPVSDEQACPPAPRQSAGKCADRMMSGMTCAIHLSIVEGADR